MHKTAADGRWKQVQVEVLMRNMIDRMIETLGAAGVTTFFFGNMMV